MPTPRASKEIMSVTAIVKVAATSSGVAPLFEKSKIQLVDLFSAHRWNATPRSSDPFGDRKSGVRQRLHFHCRLGGVFPREDWLCAPALFELLHFFQAGMLLLVIGQSLSA